MQKQDMKLLKDDDITEEKIKQLLKAEKGETFLGFLYSNLLDYIKQRNETSRKSIYWKQYDQLVYDWVRVINAYKMDNDPTLIMAPKEEVWYRNVCRDGLSTMSYRTLKEARACASSFNVLGQEKITITGDDWNVEKVEE